MKRHFTIVILAACLLAVAAAALRAGAPPAPVRVTLAVPTQLAAGAVQVGLVEGMFAKHQVTLATQSFRLGKQALESLTSGQADLAIVGDTPAALAALRGEKIGIVASVFSSRKAMALLARRGRGIATGADLAGKTIGTVRGTNAHYFLDALLLANGVSLASVDIAELEADGLTEALRSGRVDAVTLWQPDLARLQAELGAAAHTIYGDDIFVYRFLLVGRPQYLRDNLAAVTRVVAGLADATDFIHNQPRRAAELIGKPLGVETAVLAGAFDVTDYNLTLDQSLLLTLSDQARWAGRNHLVPQGGAPDFLGMLRQQPLRAVRPDAIRVIE